MLVLKGHWTNNSIITRLFPNIDIFIPLEVIEKSRRNLPDTVDRMSKYVTALGPEWSKSDYGPLSPVR